MSETSLTSVAHVIQLSVAPVFLLTSVGTILAVLSTRLGRIVDRARVLSERLPPPSATQALVVDAELHLLARRRHLVNLAITSGVCAALFVCILIASAFIGSILGVNASNLVAILFVAAMAAIVTALLCFLREVLLAVASVRID